MYEGYPNWRGYSEYGGGAICDFGAHHFDIAQWALGMDESGPVEVRPPEKPDAVHGAVMVYENGVTVTQVDRGGKMRWGGIRFFGTDGEVEVDRGQFEFVRGGKSIPQGRAEKEFLANAKIRLYASKSHGDDFLARVADRKRPVASEIEGGHTAILCCLVNLAYYHRRTIKWDPRKLAFAAGTTMVGLRPFLADARLPQALDAVSGRPGSVPLASPSSQGITDSLQHNHPVGQENDD